MPIKPGDRAGGGEVDEGEQQRDVVEGVVERVVYVRKDGFTLVRLHTIWHELACTTWGRR
ncbi:hypothetical protein ACFWXO_16750 [Kitasatospora sp. NPDC059088]|uniref:hypothetical protein n=1 Tax=Kitasatospora sp. NPDC059088 TaxID=3346722 RepID=UPI00367A0635